jgi:hypothetical protein
VWKGKDIVVFREGRVEVGGGEGEPGIADKVRCDYAACKADQTQPCCRVWLVSGTQLKPIQ